MGFEPIWKFDGEKFVGIVWVKCVEASDSSYDQQQTKIKEAS